MFKNTTKLVISNFSNVWKLLLYKLVVLLIVAGLFCTTLGYLNSLSSFSALLNPTTNFLTTANLATAPGTILGSLWGLLGSVWTVITELAITYPLILAWILVIFVVILPYLWHLSDIAISEEIFGYMASQTKYGVVSSFVRNLNRCNAFGLYSILLALPLNVLLFAGVAGCAWLATLGGAWAICAPLLVVIWAILYFSLRGAIFLPWPSAVAVTNASIAKGFARALLAVGRNFFKIWSNTIMLVFIFLIITTLTGVFGFVIILPLFCFVGEIFGMVVFFECQGMRYYVDFNTIITPKKFEQTDKPNNLKYII